MLRHRGSQLASPARSVLLHHRPRSLQPMATSSNAVNSGVANLYPHGLKSLPGPTALDVLKRLGPKFEEVPLDQGSAFVKPRSLMYNLDGKTRRWDAIESHGSVGVVLYHTEWRAFIIVRQFRPAVYACALRAAKKEGAPMPCFSQGFTFELCAGILDKAKSLEETVKEEIEEETGYTVNAGDVKFINSHISSSGTAGARHHMFYAEVDESKRATAGGGLADHGELIEVLRLPLDSTPTFILDPSLNTSPGLMFGLMWAREQILAGKMGSGSSNPLLTDSLELRPVLPS